LILAVGLLAGGLFPSSPWAEGFPMLEASPSGDPPLWWVDAQAKADRDGYRLISFEALEELMLSGRDFILIDARTRYEYEAGRLTGSVWMEFFPGEDQALAPGKRDELRRRIGPNLDRPVVTVCRNYA
jgi:hypothetical protein